MGYIIIILTSLFAYLFGSFPSGYIIVKKLYGIDIRTKGSGNIGSTNVKRVAGPKISIITQIIDISKGLISILIGIIVSKNVNLPISRDIYFSIMAILAILGHDYSIFLGFKGGKGVNTTLGAFVILAPLPTFSGILVHYVLKVFTNIVSIRSIALGVAIPIMCAIMKLSTSIIIASTIAAVLIIIRHKDNLIRLVNGAEK